MMSGQSRGAVTGEDIEHVMNSVAALPSDVRKVSELLTGQFPDWGYAP
jgi:hypothetical protein